MKINKYIIIIVVALFFASCEKDDAADVAPLLNNIQVIIEPFGSIVTTNYVGGPGTATLDMQLGFRVTDFTTTYNGSDINILYAGNTYTIPAGDTEVLTGSTQQISVAIDIAPSSIPFDGLETTIQVVYELDNINYEIEVSNRPADLVVLKDNSGTIIADVDVTLYPGFPTASSGNLELVFLNEDAQGAIWFGMSLFTSAGGWITDYNGNSNGGYPRFMSIPLDGAGDLGTIPNSVDVVPDVIALNLYTQTTIFGSMEYLILAVSPDGSVQELTGILPATSAGVDTAIVQIDVTDDVANPGMKNYVLSNF